MRTYLAIFIMTTSIAAWAADQPIAVPRLLNAQELPVEIEPAALQRQYDALKAMRLQTIQYSRQGPVHYIKGETGIVLPLHVARLNVGESADEFMELFKDLLLASGDETLAVTENEASPPSAQRLKFSQSIRGIPVIHGGASVEFDATTRQVLAFVSNFIPNRGLPREPKISASRAEQTVAETLALAKDGRADEIEITNETYLGYYKVYTDSSPPCLVWVVETSFKGSHERFFVDAVSGNIVDSQETSLSLTRKVYDANNTSPSIPNGLETAMTSAQIAADPWAYEAWFDVSVADSNLRQRLLLPTSRFPTKTHQIVRYLMSVPTAKHKTFGSDDYIWYSPPSFFTNSATSSPDITYHEYSHGIAERTFGFDGDPVEYRALHEGFADMATTVVDVAVHGAPVSDSWRIAEGFYVYPGSALRSLANPSGDALFVSGDWFPKRDLRTNTSGEYNSTIFSHAYYLSIYGGLHSRVSAPEIPEILVPALSPLPADAEARARQIFAQAFDDASMDFAPTFQKLKSAAMSKANLLYGVSAQTSIQTAFEAVGICDEYNAPPATAPLVTIFDHSCLGQFDASWPAVANATRYYAEVTVPVLGWAFAAPISDVTETECSFQISQTAHYRIRACNDCGCGPWSPTKYLEYHSPCL